MPEDKNAQPQEKPQYEPPIAISLSEQGRALGQGLSCDPGSGNELCYPGSVATVECDAGADGLVF